MRGLALDTRIRVRQNLATNPSFEYGLTGWTGANGATLSSSTDSHSGTYALLATSPAFSGQTGAGMHLNITSRSTFTFSAWVKTSAPDVYLQAQQSGYSSSHVPYSGGGDWQRLSLTVTLPIPFAGSFYCLFNDPRANATLLLDDAMLTEGPDLVDYFDGDSANSRWTGTPGASSSLHLDLGISAGGGLARRCSDLARSCWELAG